MPTAVRGYRELATAFAKADKQTKKGLPLVMRAVAEPVRSDAASLAGSRIRNIGDKWSQMRTGVTRKLVYVAPKQRGAKKASSRGRPNLARLLSTRALEPALAHNAANIERAVERAFDELADDFNRGGIT